MKTYMGVEVQLHSFLISQLDEVIGQISDHAALQLVKIPRYALRRGWAHVGTFLGRFGEETASSPAEN